MGIDFSKVDFEVQSTWCIKYHLNYSQDLLK